MKLLSATQLREADRLTAERQGINSYLLMQRASAVCADVICNRFGAEMPIVVFCGIRNNGGDGLCIARILHRVGYTVDVRIIAASSTPSVDFTLALRELEATPGTRIHEGIPPDAVPENAIVIDAILGTGITRPVSGNGLEAIDYINNSKARVISIDMPSGMPADPVAGIAERNTVRATATITFNNPKLSMLLPQYGESSGELIIVDIGLDQEYISHIPDRYQLVTAQLIKTLYRPRNRFSHKGTFGHALLVAGSKGKVGAALLAAKACLRSGAGLLTLQIPGCGYIPAQTAVPEAMVITDPDENIITLKPELGNYSAIGIGPGIGSHPFTTSALKQILETATVPVILDADALNILSSHPELLNDIPNQSVFTPHPGEFRRLAGDWHGDAELLQKAEQFATKNKCILVLKGHRTIITNGSQTWFNSTGNSGMAKGGSGDVLTGLLTGLIASGYEPLHAALLGVYLHGKAGDLAAAKKSPEGMTAGNLVDYISVAWKTFS